MKRALAAAAVVFSAMAAAALLPGYAQGGERASPTLRVGLNGWENNLTPFSITFASQPTTADLLNLVYDTLFWSQARPDPEPWLAEQASPSADHRIWTVNLRAGVKWHDGTPFTAGDVKFSFEYYKRHAEQTGRYGHHVAQIPTFERAQVLGSEEVRLFFTDPVPAFRTLPGADLPMLPKHVWEGVEEPLKATEDEPVGTGPFVVREMAAPERYKLKANPDYFKGKPLVDEIDLVVARDPNVSFNDLVAGKLDMVSSTVPPIFVDQLSGNPDIKVVQASRMESLQLNFNTRKPPLSDPKLRKAISLSIDNRVLVKTVAGGRGRPGVDTFIHPESTWASPNPQHDFNVGKANQILDSAGYSRRDGEGIRRSPDGERLAFSALFSTLEPQSLQALQIISQMTTAIGVRMEPEPATPAELRSVRRTAPPAIPGYDAYVSQLEAHAHSDPDGLLFFFHSPGRGMGAQITGYSNPSFDRLVDEASTTVSVPERKRKLEEAQKIFAEEVPSLALFYPDGVYAFRPAAYDGWVPDPGQGIFTKRSFLEDYAKAAGTPGRQRSIPPAWVFLGGVAALVFLGSGLVMLRRPSAPVENLSTPDSPDAGQDPETPFEAEPGDELPAVTAAAASQQEGAPETQSTAQDGRAEEDLFLIPAADASGTGLAAGGEQGEATNPAPGLVPESPPLPDPPRWGSFFRTEPLDAPKGPPPLPSPPATEDLPRFDGPVERAPEPGEVFPVLSPPDFGRPGEGDEGAGPQSSPLGEFPSVDDSEESLDPTFPDERPVEERD